MSHEDQIRQRWHSIAQQLGLETETEPPSATPPPPPEPEPRPVADTKRLEAVSPPAEAEVKPEGPLSPRGRRRRESTEEAAPLRDEMTPEYVVSAETEAEAPAADHAEQETHASPIGRQRRGRRGQRSTNEASAEELPEVTESVPLDEAAQPATEEQAEQGRSGERSGRRGRGRSRRRKPETAEATADVPEVKEDAPPIPEPEEPEEADTDEMEGLHNWTVPSWQELIASLYRPER